jgi:hypothetical protein
MDINEVAEKLASIPPVRRGFYAHQRTQKGQRKNWPAFPLLLGGFRLDSLVFSGILLLLLLLLLLILRRRRVLLVFPWGSRGCELRHKRAWLPLIIVRISGGFPSLLARVLQSMHPALQELTEVVPCSFVESHRVGETTTGHTEFQLLSSADVCCVVVSCPLRGAATILGAPPD